MITAIIPMQVRRTTMAADPGESVPVPVAWGWDPADPWCVTLAFGEELVWGMGRQLVTDGLTSEAGECDVFIRPEEDGMAAMILNAPDGASELTFPRSPVWAFLSRTFEVTPPGLESIPDSEYNSLLTGEETI